MHCARCTRGKQGRQRNEQIRDCGGGEMMWALVFIGVVLALAGIWFVLNALEGDL